MATRAHTTRRQVLKALPALGLAPGAALAALAAVDPHPAWLAEWLHYRNYWNSPGTGDIPDEASEAQWELGGRIAFTKATTQEGLVAQLEYALEEFTDYCFGNCSDDRDEAVVRNLLASLRGLA